MSKYKVKKNKMIGTGEKQAYYSGVLRYATTKLAPGRFKVAAAIGAVGLGVASSIDTISKTVKAKKGKRLGTFTKNVLKKSVASGAGHLSGYAGLKAAKFAKPVLKENATFIKRNVARPISNKSHVVFRRVRGRIIPIKVKK